MTNRIVFAALLVVLSIAGCGHSSTPRPVSTMTEAQRDSAIARSNIIPGARAVGRAFEVSGKSATYSAQMDSLSR